jgi:hypothetical protein
MALTNAEIAAACATVRDAYLAMPQRPARERFAIELQGFIAAEHVRGGGVAVDAVCMYVVELLSELVKAQPL